MCACIFVYTDVNTRRDQRNIVLHICGYVHKDSSIMRPLQVISFQKITLLLLSFSLCPKTIVRSFLSLRLNEIKISIKRKENNNKENSIILLSIGRELEVVLLQVFLRIREPTYCITRVYCLVCIWNIRSNRGGLLK